MTAGLTLAADGENNPLTTFADKISVNDSADSTDMGVSATSAPESLGQLQPLSQMAWDQQNGVQSEVEAVPENGDVTTSQNFTPALETRSGAPAGGTAGVSDMGEVPSIDTHYGNPNGGNYVTDDATTGETIVKVARAMLGKPYIWGGEDWSGADCSGLVQLAYKQAGIEMPRLSNYQMNKGKQVDYKDLKPGDLVGWNNSNHVVGADHIAIYIGNNQIIEAPRPGVNIRVAGLYDYDTAEMWAVRVPSSKPIAPSKPKAAPKPKGKPSVRAVQGEDTPKPEQKPNDMHSTGRLAAKN